MTKNEGVRLDYSPRLPLQRRLVFRRLVFLVTVGCLLAASIVWGPRAWKRGQILYYQHQCLVYTAPADRVVYEPDPARAAVLIRNGGGMEYWGGKPSPEYAIASNPSCLTKSVSVWPAPNPTTAITSGLGFMHELRNHKGDRRLVLISPPLHPGFVVYFIVPLTGCWGQVPLGTNFMGSCYSRISLGMEGYADPQYRIYAGQMDPGDPSHFTFVYESEKGRGTIDGWLTNECYINMKVRDGPAINPPPHHPMVIDGGHNDYNDLLGRFPGLGFQKPDIGLIDDRPR